MNEGLVAIACAALGVAVGFPLLGVDVDLPVRSVDPLDASATDTGTPPTDEPAPEVGGRRVRPVRVPRHRDGRTVTPVADETWRIELLGRGGLAVPDALLRVAGDAGSGVRTDVHGRAAFELPGGSGQITLEGARLPHEWVTLTERETVLRTDAILPLEVQVVDALSGELLSLPSIQLREGSDSESVPIDGVRGGHAFLATLDAGALDARVIVRAPDGYAVESEAVETLRGAISVFARSVAVQVPVRRECTLRIHVEDADGTPAGGAVLGSVKLGGQNLPLRKHRTRLVADSRGEIHLRGIPYLHGEALSMRVRRGEWSAALGAVPLLAPGPVGDVTVRLVERSTRRGGSRNLRCGSGCGGRRGDVPPPGAVRVTVRRRDGSPAARAMVSFRHRTHRVDEHGVVLFESVPEGAHRFVVAEPGFVLTSELLSVRAGVCTEVTIDEAPGRTVEVLVVDHSGRPVPFARIDVDVGYGNRYARLDARGVQDLTLYTDACGACTLPGLSRSLLVNVRAEFGSRKAIATIKSDTAGTVLIRLPEPQ